MINVFQANADEITKNINNDRPYFEGLDNIEPITLESIVAHPTSTVAKKSKVVKSVVGVNLNLGGNSKVTFSVICDNVKIGSK
jgi:NDP-sugar pyrophosphorylase family protein